MKKLYCDLCEKEIEGEDYVTQTIISYYDYKGSIESDICKKCWEKESKKK